METAAAAWSVDSLVKPKKHIAWGSRDGQPPTYLRRKLHSDKKHRRLDAEINKRVDDRASGCMKMVRTDSDHCIAIYEKSLITYHEFVCRWGLNIRNLRQIGHADGGGVLSLLFVCLTDTIIIVKIVLDKILLRERII